ncbi:Addiction module killer protein [Gammaproteobacteria bacterium]
MTVNYDLQNVAYRLELIMPTIIQSETFKTWREGLRDREALARVNARIRRLANGNPGDVKPIGEGVSELRISHGPGYRVYFMKHSPAIVVLLAGGDKRTQEDDIKQALRISKNWKYSED